MAENWWEQLVVYTPDETATSEATEFATALDALDLAGEMDKAYNAAMDEIKICTPQYIDNVGKLLQELKKLIPKTQLEANYEASPPNEELSPSATIELYMSFLNAGTTKGLRQAWPMNDAASRKSWREESGLGILNRFATRFSMTSLTGPYDSTNRLGGFPPTDATWTITPTAKIFDPDYNTATSSDVAIVDPDNPESPFGARPELDAIGKTAREGVFFTPYTATLEAAYKYASEGGTTESPLRKAAITAFSLTMINYLLEMICKQILIAQNINIDDQAKEDSNILFDKTLRYATNNYDEYGKLRYFANDSLLPLYYGSHKKDTENEHNGGREYSPQLGLEGNYELSDTAAGKMALLGPNQELLKAAGNNLRVLSATVGTEQFATYGGSDMLIFISRIEEPAKLAGKALKCIFDAWKTVTDQHDKNNAKILELAEKHGINDKMFTKARSEQISRKESNFAKVLTAISSARNPEKLFFKEQCFLLSYISQIASHKKIAIDHASDEVYKLFDASGKMTGTTLDTEGISKEGLKTMMSTIKTPAGSEWKVVASNEHKKLLPYNGYVGSMLEKYGPQSYNATLLLDGDPYGFLNRLVCGNQEALLNIDHQVLSLLQPFIRLYKVDFDDDGNESDIEITFDSYRTPREAFLFKNSELRNTGVGLKSFNFTYDGSNPFGAKKSIKGTLKIFSNTFDELMISRGRYSYSDLALKTSNTGDKVSAIRRENENLAKLNFRLKAQIGWSVPDVATLNRMNLTESKLASLRSALYASIVTLNLTPTVHDFEFDELGRVNFTINYLAYAEETYSQAKFNVFSEAEFAAKREERNLKMKYYQKECKSDAVAKIKKKYALESNEEVSQSIANLVSTLIRLDRIYYINITQDKIKHFMSLGPFAPEITEKDMKVLDADTHQERLREDIATALAAFESQKKKKEEAVTKAEKGAVSSALATTQPEATVISFFYLSDLIDTILANIEMEIALIPEKLEELKKTGMKDKFTKDDVNSKIKEYRSYEKAFRKLRFVLGPVEFVNPKEDGQSHFVNLGDIPVSVRYWFEWLTSTMLDKDKSYYSLTSFMNDFMNKMISQFLNNSNCFNYNIRQSVNMQQATFTGPQTAASRKQRIDGGGLAGYVKDPVTVKCEKHGDARANVTQFEIPALKKPPGPVVKISSEDEVNYMIYFVGRTSPTEKMLGKKSEDEPMGIYHYQIARDRGLVKDIKLKKTSTPGLQEVRFEQQGYAGLEQLRVTYDANITCYANPNTFPGTYIYVDPAGFSPSAKAKMGIDLTKYGIGGYYMIIRTTHNFAPGDASTEIEAKWVNAIHNDDGDTYIAIDSLPGVQEDEPSECTLELRAEGLE